MRIRANGMSKELKSVALPRTAQKGEGTGLLFVVGKKGKKKVLNEGTGGEGGKGESARTLPMERSPLSKKNMIPSSVKSKPKLVRPMPISAVGR